MTFRIVAVGLAGLLVLLTGLIYPATVPHALHHAHHQATTHSSALCSWLCAAGQMADTPAPLVQIECGPAIPVDQVTWNDPTAPALFTALSRAPPPPRYSL